MVTRLRWVKRAGGKRLGASERIASPWIARGRSEFRVPCSEFRVKLVTSDK